MWQRSSCVLYFLLLLFPASTFRIKKSLSRDLSTKDLEPFGTHASQNVSVPCEASPKDNKKRFWDALHEKGSRVLHINEHGVEVPLTQIVVNDLPCHPLADPDLASANLFVTENAKVYVVADDELRNGTNDLTNKRCLLAELFKNDPRDPHFDGYLANVDRCSEKRSGSQMMLLADHLYSCSCHHRVRLQDVSKLYCVSGEYSEIFMQLGLFRTLTRGQSFYQQFGFQYIKGGDLTSEPELRENIELVQEALYTLKVEELQRVHESCTKDRGFEKAVDKLFLTFKRQHGRGRRVGEFFEWLWKRDCTQASRVLDATVVLPCCAYPRDSPLRKLRLGNVPEFTGRMMKIYN